MDDIKRRELAAERARLGGGVDDDLGSSAVDDPAVRAPPPSLDTARKTGGLRRAFSRFVPHPDQVIL